MLEAVVWLTPQGRRPLLERSAPGVFIIFSLQKGLAPIPVPEFSNLPLIPTGDLRKIARDPRDAIHILGSAVDTG